MLCFILAIIGISMLIAALPAAMGIGLFTIVLLVTQNIAFAGIAGVLGILFGGLIRKSLKENL